MRVLYSLGFAGVDDVAFVVDGPRGRALLETCSADHRPKVHASARISDAGVELFEAGLPPDCAGFLADDALERCAPRLTVEAVALSPGRDTPFGDVARAMAIVRRRAPAMKLDFSVPR